MTFLACGRVLRNHARNARTFSISEVVLCDCLPILGLRLSSYSWAIELLSVHWLRCCRLLVLLNLLLAYSHSASISSFPARGRGEREVSKDPKPKSSTQAGRPWPQDGRWQRVALRSCQSLEIRVFNTSGPLHISFG